MPPPPRPPPRKITLTIQLIRKDPKGRATLADANDAIGAYIEHINGTELHNRNGDPIEAIVRHFEVG